MNPFKRSLFSVFSNFVKAIFSLATGLLIARGLGPYDYGILTFLLASFTSLGSLLDIGTSSAFYSFISKKKQPKSLFILYLIWLTFQFLILLLFINILAPESWVESIWQGENKERIIIAFVAVFLQQKIWGMLSQIGESQRETVFIQSINLINAMIHLIIIFILFYFNILVIEKIFMIIIIEFLFISLTTFYFLKIEYSLEEKTTKQIIEEYRVFCQPLLLYTLIALGMNFFDTWLLQKFGGSIEQAYYGVGYRFSAISLLATQSIINVLWKEVSESNELNDKARVLRIYSKSSRTIFISALWFSCLFIPWSSEIIQLTLGVDYLGGSSVLAVMFLLPIYQSLGQLNSTIYYGLELTKPHAIMGVIFMLISIITVYFLISPSDLFIPGLGLGSIGLAIKMVSMQVIAVIFSTWWLSKNQGWYFSIKYQIVGFPCFFISGMISKKIAYLIFYNETISLSYLTFSFLMYLIFTSSTIYLMPWLINLTKKEINSYIVAMKRMIKT